MSINPDFLFVVGLVTGLLAIPSLISAFSESRTPRSAAALIMLSAALIAGATILKPGGYSLQEAPDVFFEVVGRIVN